MLRVCSALEEDLSLIPSTYNSLLTPPGDLIAPTLGGTCTHLYPHAYTHMSVRTHVHAHTLKFNKNLGIMFSFIYIFLSMERIMECERFTAGENVGDIHTNGGVEAHNQVSELLLMPRKRLSGSGTHSSKDRMLNWRMRHRGECREQERGKEVLYLQLVNAWHFPACLAPITSPH